MRVEAVESLGDPRIADYRNLKQSSLRSKAGVFIVESRLGVQRLLDSRFRPRSIFVTETALAALRPGLARLGDDTPVYVARSELLSAVAGYPVHRGCLAAAERGDATGVDEILGRLPPGPAKLLVLENVIDPENVGGIFRNAAAFGAHAVLLTPRCADPLYRKSIRVSMGATLRVPFARWPDWPRGLSRLQGAGLALLAFSLGPGATPLPAWGRARQLPERVALLLGAEGEGLSPEVLRRVDHELKIPMAPGVDSLNVATASGIALHCLGVGTPG